MGNGQWAMGNGQGAMGRIHRGGAESAEGRGFGVSPVWHGHRGAMSVQSGVHEHGQPAVVHATQHQSATNLRPALAPPALIGGEDGEEPTLAGKPPVAPDAEGRRVGEEDQKEKNEEEGRAPPGKPAVAPGGERGACFACTTAPEKRRRALVELRSISGTQEKRKAPPLPLPYSLRSIGGGAKKAPHPPHFVRRPLERCKD